MSNDIRPEDAREILAHLDSAPRPSKKLASVAVALAAWSFAPSLLANVWMQRHGGVRTDWWLVGIGCTAVMVLAAALLIARLTRVARGWAKAPRFALGVAGICYGSAVVLVSRLQLGYGVVIALAIGSAVVSHLVAHVFADAPDDLYLSRTAK